MNDETAPKWSVVTYQFPARGEKIEWDGPNLKITNVPEANRYLRRPYRKGWSL